MIYWRTLGFFVLTIAIITGLITGVGLFGYDKALGFVFKKHPELKITPNSAAVYEPDPEILKDYTEIKDKYFSIMVPKNARVTTAKRKDPQLYLSDPGNAWDITVGQKLMRYDDSLVSNDYIKNPDGDYYQLLNYIFHATKDPILLFQKISYLPSDARYIKTIKTPNYSGFYIVGQSGSSRTEYYMLFDDKYWTTITVYVDDNRYPHAKIQTMLASLKNNETSDTDEEEQVETEELPAD
ncbi:MAG: hypothetical protein LWY06_06805 [Firmicutes bacterium]|nr:hypothetical protein [Bacillota bacterium]